MHELLVALPLLLASVLAVGLVVFAFRWPLVAPKLVGVGSAVLAIVPLASLIDQKLVVLPEVIYRVALVAGIELVVVGLAFWVLPIDSLKSRVSEMMEPPRFRLRQVRLHELETLYRVAVSFFGKDIASIETMTIWHRKNPALFYLVEETSTRHDRRTSKVVGLFDVIPVNKAAVELLEAEKVAGASLKPEHIVRKHGHPSAIYIGGVAARGFKAKAWILGRLDERMETFRRRGLTIYGRPVTKEGLALLRKHDFLPVASTASPNELYRVYKLEGRARDDD